MSRKRKVYSSDLKNEPMYESFPDREKFFSETLKSLFKKARDYRKKDWKRDETEEGCALYTLNLPNNNYTASMGRRKIKSKLSPKDFIDFAHSVTLNPKWGHLQKKLEPNYVYYESIHNFSSGMSDLCHIRYTAKTAFVSDRDFVILRRRAHASKFSHMFGGSFEISEEDKGIYPECKKCCRSEVFCFMWTVTKPSKDTLFVEYFTHSSPGGYLPTTLFNRTVKQKALCVLNYTKEFADWSKPLEKKLLLEEQRKKKLIEERKKLESLRKSEVKQPVTVQDLRKQKESFSSRLIDLEKKKEEYDFKLRKKMKTEDLTRTILKNSQDFSQLEKRKKEFSMIINKDKRNILAHVKMIKKVENMIKDLEERISSEVIKEKGIETEEKLEMMETKSEKEKLEDILTTSSDEEDIKFDDEETKIEEIEGEKDEDIESENWSTGSKILAGIGASAAIVAFGFGVSFVIGRFRKS